MQLVHIVETANTLAIDSVVGNDLHFGIWVIQQRKSSNPLSESEIKIYKHIYFESISNTCSQFAEQLCIDLGVDSMLFNYLTIPNLNK